MVYVEELIGPDTVNTVPPKTLEAFEAHGEVEETLTRGVAEAHEILGRLRDAGVDMRAVTDKLLDDGVEAFKKPFSSLLRELDIKRSRLLMESS